MDIRLFGHTVTVVLCLEYYFQSVAGWWGLEFYFKALNGGLESVVATTPPGGAPQLVVLVAHKP